MEKGKGRAVDIVRELADTLCDADADKHQSEERFVFTHSSLILSCYETKYVT